MQNISSLSGILLASQDGLSPIELVRMALHTEDAYAVLVTRPIEYCSSALHHTDFDPKHRPIFFTDNLAFTYLVARRHGPD